MRSGIRFTCLKNGDNLLGQTWEYKGLIGVEAIQSKLQDMFLHVNKLKITDVIDTIQISKDASNSLYIANSGINGDIWPFNQRIEEYKKYIGQYKLNMVAELEFPTIVTTFNYMQYAQYAVTIIDKYSWIKYWQIMTVPEQIDKTGAIKCPPELYVQMLKYIHDLIHNKYSDIKIGGPGILTAINEYVKSSYSNEDKQTFHTGWLAEATGELFGTNTKYDLTEKSGFLPYIDFFAFQGDESSGEFDYDTFQPTINAMKLGVIVQAQRNGINLDIEFLSTEQGHYADKSSVNDMQLQGYRDLREYINDFATNVIPYKKQLVDEFYDETDKNSKKNTYGILYHYLGNERKPSYQEFYFLLNKLYGYNKIVTDDLLIKSKLPYEKDLTIDSLMFINDTGDKILSVVFPKTERILTPNNTIFTKVTLKPALNRKVYIPNGNEVQITSPLDVNFKKYDFIVVEEKLVKSTSDDADVTAEVKKRMAYYQGCFEDLLGMVPDDYNKDVYDINYVKLLRSLGIEYGDANYEKGILEDNMYLSTAHGDAIYNNFGALIGVPWKTQWSQEKYREVVSGIIESLLSGANKNSITKAIKAYTGFDVHIYELFTDYAHYGLNKEINWDNQYRFTVEIEKSIDSTAEITEVYSDVKEVTNIVRPAHTIPIIMIVLVGEENYREWYKERYGVDFSNSDNLLIEKKDFEESNVYGWKNIDYDFVLKATSDGKNSTNTNSAFPIAPKYTLYDRDWVDILDTEDVHVPKPKEEWMPWLIVNYEDVYNKKPKDEFTVSLDMYLQEAKFGIKPLSTDRTLKTNGGLQYDANGNIIKSENRTTNTFRTGIHYALRDDLWILFEYFDKEKYDKAKESQMLWEAFVDWNEIYKKPKEEEKVLAEFEFRELKYGLVPYTKYTAMTYSKNPRRRLNRVVNHSRYGIRYRMHEDSYVYFDVCEQETYDKTKVSEDINMKLYVVDSQGKETIIRQSDL